MRAVVNCAQFEILLADYLDGAMAPGERAGFVRHLESCAACAVLLEDAEAALEFMERAAEAEAPPVLVNRILAATNGGWELKLRSGGWRGWINRTFAPVLQPRVVMGAMLTVMSATALVRLGGTPETLMTAVDYRGHRVWDRTVKGYESMRLVYEVKQQLDDWREQQTEEEEAAVDARRLEIPENPTR